MTWYEALILGIIQGLTEFLPVSSSGHLEIGSVLFNVQASDNLLFAITVHFATAVATIIVFKDDIIQLVKELFQFKWNDSTKYISFLAISMIPVFIVGVFFKDEVESLFTGNLVLVGAMLLITGGLLLFAHFNNGGSKSVNPISSFIIGIAQAVAVLPGISRSGATISTALLLGIERSKAARFSFLMVLVPIIGASLLQVKDYTDAPQLHSISPLVLIIGFLGAFISGYMACKWMIAIVKKGKLTNFAIYCFIVGLVAIISSL